jgi:glycosyltransferase involved in cell wall biosynthesis
MAAQIDKSSATAPRVMHLVPALFGPAGIVGGAERYAYELARYMSREVPTRLVAFGDRAAAKKIGGLEVHVLGRPWYVRGQRTNPIALRLLRELRSVDVVHCHQRHVLASSVTALLCRLTGRRVFVTNLGGGGWDISAYLATDSWYNAHLHLSDFSRRSEGHDAKPFAHVILGGVDVEKFAPGEGLERDGSVLFVGRLLPHKGIDVLIEALPPEMPLEIIGREFDQRYLNDLRRLAGDKRVNFRFDCDDDQLVQAYRRAACVVLPSVTRTRYGQATPAAELLGQTLLEGMACGSPVICTAVGGMPEVVRAGVTGFVVAPGDRAVLGERLRWIRAHPAEALRMGAAGRRMVLEHFTWPRVVRRCLKIYRRPA